MAARHLQARFQTIVNKSVTEGTHDVYETNWADLIFFMNNQLERELWLPVSTDVVALYIAHLDERGYRASSIQQKLLAISYLHTMRAMEDPCKAKPIVAAIKCLKWDQLPSEPSALITEGFIAV